VEKWLEGNCPGWKIDGRGIVQDSSCSVWLVSQVNIALSIRAGTIQSVSIQYRYRGQRIRIDTVILSYRYTNMETAAKMKKLFRKESSCFLKTKSLNIYHHLSV